MLINRKKVEPTKSFYEKWSRWIVVATWVFIPVSFYYAARAIENNVNRVEDWLPKSFEETQNLDWFRRHFATDQFIIVSWKGCQLGIEEGSQDDPRLERLAQLLIPKESLMAREEQSAVLSNISEVDQQSSRRYFKSAVTGRHLLDQITHPPLSLPLSTAVKRLKGSMIGPDGKQTCLIVTLHPEALSELKLVVGSGKRRIFRENVAPGILHRMIQQAGIPEEEVHLGGPPIDNNAIDEEGERTLVRLAGLSGLFGLGLAWWSLRSVVLTLMVFSCGVISAATSLAIVSLTGYGVDAILMSMPSLVYVLAISGAVHFINYYREAVQLGGMQTAAERAVGHAWKPALLCSVTTAVGLLSLSASELVPIRKFGVFSAAGVISLVGVTYFFLPAALCLSRIGKRWTASQASACNSVSLAQPRRASRSQRFWVWIAAVIVRRYRAVGVASLAITVLLGLGLRDTNSSIDLLKLFDTRAKILQDYRWLETNLGMLVPLEIVVRFPSSTLREDASSGDPTKWDALSFVERLESVTRLQSLIDRKFGPDGENLVGRSLSAASFAPSLPSATSGSLGYVQRKAIDARLSKSKDELSEAGFLRIDQEDGSELWRVSLRVAAFRDVDYGKFVKELEAITQPLLEAYQTRADVLQRLTQFAPTGSPVGKQVILWCFQDDQESEKSTHQTFQLLLYRLLQEYKCHVKLVTSDPSTTPLSELESLDAVAAVVVFGDFSDDDLSLIQILAPELIDARLKLDSTQTASIDQMQHTDDRRLRAIYTGVVPIVYQAQRALLNSLIESTWWSFLTITPVMMLVSRSLFAGAISMIPNVVPIFWIFGGMGWLGIPIDIGSMMTASIALGVAVDDTIHFLARYRDELETSSSREEAIVSTYGHCATPTLQAALISGLGLSVFAFSTFTPTQRFGWLMLCILLAGVLSELIVLPSLLASPIGKIFRIKASAQKDMPRIIENARIVRVDRCHQSVLRQTAREDMSRHEA